MHSLAPPLQHLRLELERLRLWLSVQLWRVRQNQPASDELAAFWISEAEIDALFEEQDFPATAGLPPLPPEAVEHVQDALAQIDAAIADFKAEATQQGQRLPLVELEDCFHLDEFDLALVIICLAPELDTRYTRLYAYLQNDVTRRHPSVELILNLLCTEWTDRISARAHLAAAAPLRRYNLIHMFGDPADSHAPLLAQMLRLDPRIVDFLLADQAIDARLAPYVQLVLPQLSPPVASLSDLMLPADETIRIAALLRGRDEKQLFYFQGPPGIGKQTTAAAVCADAGLTLLVVDGQPLVALKRDEFVDLMHLAEREARLQGAALYWRDFDALLHEDKQLHLERLLEQLAARPGITFLAGSAAWAPEHLYAGLPLFQVEFHYPAEEQRRRLWASVLNGRGSAVDLAALADKFRFTPRQIQAAAATARNQARRRNADDPQVTQDDLNRAARLHSSQRLSGLAQKLQPHFTWQDIVLPTDRLEQLREICRHVQHRALVHNTWGFAGKLALDRGLSTLFVGPPGAGKTMAAEIVAGELELDLYKIDLARVVSKYIGETEKNLARIFADAENSNAILFFDEADALFGKRTEVHDAHDRYANLEVSYLLQRVEEYAGVVILATNLRQNMDEAFVRRMHFIVEFPFPNAADRKRMWQRIWPDALPRSPELDFDFLAERIAVTGGHIRNIALAAAFLSASEAGAAGAVTMRHLLRATAREYAKLGRLPTADEFAPYAVDHKSD